jgi:DUF4097 and DUF4098 domain-containing protein YvlB
MRSTDKRVPAALALLIGLAASGCTDFVVEADPGRYVEREEKRFPTTGKANVTLSTFDGSIEVRPWDKPEVQVIIEKRARDKKTATEMDVRAEQTDNHILIEVKRRRGDDRRMHFGWNLGRSAKLIVSMPANSDLVARSGDGAIDVEEISGRVEMRSGDGNIRARHVTGEVSANSGDGTITLAGKLATVRAHTGDGSVTIQAETGSTPSGDWDISTGDGSVTLELPDGFGAEIDAHTGDGGIRMQDITVSDVVGEIKRNTIRGRIGSGGRQLRVRTGDGSITLRKF